MVAKSGIAGNREKRGEKPEPMTSAPAYATMRATGTLEPTTELGRWLPQWAASGEQNGALFE